MTTFPPQRHEMEEAKPSLLRRVAECLYYYGRSNQDKCRAPRRLDDSPAILICVAGVGRRGTHLPTGDVLFHVGNLSRTGTFDDIQAQISWLSRQAMAGRHGPLCLAGERDLLLDPRLLSSQPDHTPPGKMPEDINWQDVTWLRDKLTW